MQNKLQELTEKIYQEGIAKGNQEADQIIDKAKKEAKSIVDNARKEAEKIVAEAMKKSVEKQTNTESELKLSAKQAVNALKQQITDIINGNIVKEEISKSFNDKDFIKKIIELTLKNWSAGSTNDIAVLLPESNEKELKQYFAKSVKNLLDKGLELKFDSGIKSGFQISPKDGSYKVSFTEEDFINFFKQYLRPKLVELLYSE
jgi:V/A-type H+/Na+-transporting ATPase subunit E